jgi:hypothetical protein
MVKKFQQFEAAIKWYSKGELSDDVNSKPKEIPHFYRGQDIKLVDKINSYWDGDNFGENGSFRTSVRGNNVIMTVDEDDLKEIQGHLCVHCRASGWYKISCVETL